MRTRIPSEFDAPPPTRWELAAYWTLLIALAGFCVGLLILLFL